MRATQIEISEEIESQRLNSLKNLISTIKGSQKQIIPVELASNLSFEIEIFWEDQDYKFLVETLLNNKKLNENILTIKEIESIFLKNDVRKLTKINIVNPCMRLESQLDSELFGVVVNLVEIRPIFRFDLKHNRVKLEIVDATHVLYKIQEDEIAEYLNKMNHPVELINEMYNLIPEIFAIYQREELEKNHSKELAWINQRIEINHKKYDSFLKRK